MHLVYYKNSPIVLLAYSNNEFEIDEFKLEYYIPFTYYKLAPYSEKYSRLGGLFYVDKLKKFQRIIEKNTIYKKNEVIQKENPRWKSREKPKIGEVYSKECPYIDFSFSPNSFTYLEINPGK